jgi:hypothetical protein
MEREGAKDPEQPEVAASGLPAHVASRVEAIVRAAEQEAAAVQRDIAAERQAAADRLRELTDGLVERAEAARTQLDELLAALERTAAAVDTRALGGDTRTNQSSADPEDAARAPAPDDLRPPLAGARDLSAVRLVAIEMAVAGRSRSEVDRHLHEAFGVADTRALLDDVFGGVERAG